MMIAASCSWTLDDLLSNQSSVLNDVSLLDCRSDSSHANLEIVNVICQKPNTTSSEWKVDLGACEETHVVSELPRRLSVNRGNGKIDTCRDR